MPSEFIQRQIDRLLGQVEEAIDANDWERVADLARRVQSIDSENSDARDLLTLAGQSSRPTAEDTTRVATPAVGEPTPTSFVDGRYQVERFLGEGGKKRVYLAHDTLLDRDVAFALIKTEGLDEVGRERIAREAQAMGRLGTHPHVVSVFDLGEHQGPDGSTQPYIVTELMGGGDVEGLLEDAEGPLELSRSLEIATGVARGLEFAHAKDVVHRDLKPGNVWLAEDGVAKIGDFGLAVSLDRSRLTQHGMMVGTVAYMPPEQALGGETTPQADLYSLGAMLYELVTGRLPFVGEDPTAIISQHINTPPVAPSWHSEHCPPDLEELILHLLAKAPEDRPASAAEVLAALEAVDPAATSARDSGANPLDRLARGVFVGRGAELERLRTAFDEAFSGRGRVVMLVGGPGIGKTRTAQELETYARMRGAQVLWGRAHESSGAPAYWPWVQALRSHIASADPETLRSHLGSGAGEVARVVSEVRERLPEVEVTPPIDDPEETRFRLFDSISSFLRTAADETPLVLALDDLHWADAPTLLLLTHVAREIGRARLLVVGTYRDTDLDRAHPLSAALVEMNREQLFQRISLRGLSREEVASYVRSAANVEPPTALLDRVYEETEGNPFFLSEVVALIAEEGAMGDGVITTVAIPEGVREALGQRLDRLTEGCNELTTIAAVSGREFGYALLSALTDHDDEALLRLVEEALGARVIEETGVPGEYRFTHALMQETLLGELSITRRVRLHGAIASSLERLYGGEVERHAAELAHHFLQSATLTREHAAQAIRYSESAAEQAERQLAWDEAIRHLEHALTALRDLGDPPPAEEAAMLAALGRCQIGLGGPPLVAWTNCLRAIELYSEIGDGVRAAETALAALAAPNPNASARLELVAKGLAAIGDREPALEAQLLAEQSAHGDAAAAGEAASRAASLAAQHGLTDVQARLEVSRGWRAIEEVRFADAEAPLRSAHKLFDSQGDYLRAGVALQTITIAQMLAGDLDRCEAETELAFEYASEHRVNNTADGSRARLAMIANARCDRERFDSLASEMPETSGLYRFMLLARAMRALKDGQPTEAQELAASVTGGGPGAPGLALIMSAARAPIFLAQGDGERASAELSSWEQALAANPPALIFRTATYAWAADALTALGDAKALRSYYDEICGWPSMRASYLGTGMDNVRGQFALRLDLIDEAERHFRTGLEWCERERCPVEAGRCLQGLAELAERRGEHAEAMEHLDRAGELFSEHGAKLYLDQVLAKKEILRA